MFGDEFDGDVTVLEADGLLHREGHVTGRERMSNSAPQRTAGRLRLLQLTSLAGLSTLAASTSGSSIADRLPSTRLVDLR
ncbi:hypothetical protein [Streptomyces sp. NPDC001536]|uniref:hypothetical protein n=1 Tax=Streptomyces sp. NPDC001536 TaxID=3364583 RepID=UPI003691786C